MNIYIYTKINLFILITDEDDSFMKMMVGNKMTKWTKLLIGELKENRNIRETTGTTRKPKAI